MGRREVIVGSAGLAGLAMAGRAKAQGQETVKLAFCSQLLCVVPYEFTRAQGLFEAEGLTVELVYTRGGNAAMQALVGGAVDYAGTSFDVALQAFANGAPIRRFATTGRLPLFALAVAPSEAGAIGDLKALEGRTVGVSALGNADHTMLLYLLDRGGRRPGQGRVRRARPQPLRGAAARAGRRRHGAGAGAHPHRRGRRQGALQRHGHRRLHPAPRRRLRVHGRLLPRRGARGAARADAGAGPRAARTGSGPSAPRPIPEIRASLPAELLVGGDGERFDEIIARYRDSLYPEEVAIDVEACARVVNALEVGGVLKPGTDLDALLDTEVVAG